MLLKGLQGLSLSYSALTTKKFYLDIKLKFLDYISKVTYTYVKIFKLSKNDEI